MTGDFAPRKGKGIFEFNIGGLSVLFAAWVAEVQDPCILRLDFLKAVGGVLDLGKDSLTLPDGRLVKLTPPTSNLSTLPLSVSMADLSSHTQAATAPVIRLPADAMPATPANTVQDTQHTSKQTSICVFTAPS